MDERAWAKSHPKEDIQTHTDFLLDNLTTLKKSYPNLLVKKDWGILHQACIHHDLGKLNNKFQERIKTGRRFPDEIPHGLLSLAFIDYKELKKMGYENDDIKLLFHTIAYHHDRKMPSQNADIEKEFAGLRVPFELFKYDKLPKKVSSLEEINQRYFSVGQRFYERKHEKLFFRFIKIKGLLNRLDYAASAYIKVENPNDFLEEAMDGLMSRWQRDNSNTRWNDMQEYMRSNANNNVIVIAQTGMGKTEAGLLWLGNHKGFFTLPLKSAINAIYQRIIDNIVLENKEDRVGLLHSDTFIRYLEQSELDGGEKGPGVYETKTKQLSLPLTICTLDQLFNFVFRYRGFEQKLVTLSYSKVIVDEVQMYSPELIAYLVLGLHYITRLGGQFAILTATLPTFFIDLLQEQGIQFEPLRIFTDDKIRHSLKVLDKEINAEDVLCFSQQYAGKKILVICNTIKSAASMYHQIKSEMGERQQVHLLHSHFTKTDRAIKEKHILEMGKKESSESGIWISTQIVEASLDIDFDLLFTELSDINGLFQRMGRCYRKRELMNLQYNCFVFIGGKKRCSGVGVFIDEKIHGLSKEALSRIDGVIRERQKVDMVESLYTKEKLPEYYAVIKENIQYVKSYEAYELDRKDVIKKFRDIDTVSVIPRSVYEENKTKINTAIHDLRKDYSGVEKDQARETRARARSKLTGYTVDVVGYVAHGIKTESIKINDYEQIIIAECEYNREEGIIKPVLKPKAEVEDFSAHSF
jgi:CRISPR-associated endonuclease/helicase Cas3